MKLEAGTCPEKSLREQVTYKDDSRLHSPPRTLLEVPTTMIEYLRVVGIYRVQRLWLAHFRLGQSVRVHEQTSEYDEDAEDLTMHFARC